MRKHIALLLPFIPLVLEALILIVLLFRFYLPLSYYILTILLAVVITSLIVYGRPNLCMLAAILMAGLILRMLPMIRTNFSVEPLYDGYKDIVTAELWYKMGKAAILYDNRDLEYTSSFPLLKILTVIYAYMMGPYNPWQLLVVRSALVLTLVYAFVMILFAYLFGKEVEERAGLSRLGFVLLLLFAISPDAVYYGMIYYPRFYCVMFIYILLWMIMSGKINSKYFPLASMLMITLPFTYAGYPWVLLTFIITCYIVSLLLKGKGKDYTPSPILLTLLMTGIILSWMYYVTPDLLANNLQGAINKLVNWLSIMKHKGLTERKWIETPYYIPPCLQTPLNILVKIRDLIIYVPALIGIIYTLIKKIRGQSHEVFSVLLVHVLALGILYVIFIEVQRLSFQTVLTPFIYTVLLFAAISYVAAITATLRAMCSKPRRRALLPPLLFTLIMSLATATLTAFLSPWSHRIVLKQYYDPSIDAVKAGDYDARYWYILTISQSFLKESLVYSYSLLTDRSNLLATLYPELFRENRIVRALRVDMLPQGRYLFVMLQGLNPDLGFRFNVTELYALKHHLMQTSNLVLSITEHLKIYIKP